MGENEPTGQEAGLSEREIEELKARYEKYKDEVINRLNALIRNKALEGIGDSMEGENKEDEVAYQLYLKQIEIKEEMDRKFLGEKGLTENDLKRYAAYHFYGTTPNIGDVIKDFDLSDGSIENFLRSKIEKLENQE